MVVVGQRSTVACVVAFVACLACARLSPPQQARLENHHQRALAHQNTYYSGCYYYTYDDDAYDDDWTYYYYYYDDDDDDDKKKKGDEDDDEEDEDEDEDVDDDEEDDDDDDVVWDYDWSYDYDDDDWTYSHDDWDDDDDDNDEWDDDDDEDDDDDDDDDTVETYEPTYRPTQKPSPKPTRRPSRSPTYKPSVKPTRRPSLKPTRKPSSEPTRKPSSQPSRRPSSEPVPSPTREPSQKPTDAPTYSPSRRPSYSPSRKPTAAPSPGPTPEPSAPDDPSPMPSQRSTPSEPGSATSAAPSREPSPPSDNTTPTSSEAGGGETQPTSSPTRQMPPAPTTRSPTTASPSLRPTEQSGNMTPKPTSIKGRDDPPLPTTLSPPTSSPSHRPTEQSDSTTPKPTSLEGSDEKVQPTTEQSDSTTPKPTSLEGLDEKVQPTISPTTARPTAQSDNTTPTRSPTFFPTTRAPTSTPSIVVSSQIELVGLDAQDFSQDEERVVAAAVEETLATLVEDEVARRQPIVLEARVVADQSNNNNEQARRRLEEEARLRLEVVVDVATALDATTLRDEFKSTMSDAVRDGTLETAMQSQSATALVSQATVDVEKSLELVEASTVVVETAAPVRAPTLRSSDRSEGGSNGGGSDDASLVVVVIVLVLAVLAACCAGFAYRLRRGGLHPGHGADAEERSSSTRVQAIDLVVVEENGADRTSKKSIVLQTPEDETRASRRLARESYRIRSKCRVFDWTKSPPSVSWSSPTPTSTTHEQLYVRRFASAKTGADTHGSSLVLVPAFSPDETEEDEMSLAALGGGEMLSSSSEDDDSTIHDTAASGEMMAVPSLLREALDRSAEENFAERMETFRTQTGGLRVPWSVGTVKFSVRRESIAADAYARLYAVPASHWRRPFFVSFVGEAALDAGGCSREFFQLLTKELFDVGYGLMKYGASYSYTIADDADSEKAFPNAADRRRRYTFVGRILGKALLEGHLVDKTKPCATLLKHACCEPVGLTDLQCLDYDLWKNLDVLRKMPRSQVEELALTFSVEHDVLGELVERELVPGGASVPVTAANVDDFLRLRLQERVLDVCEDGLRALLRGLYDVVPVQYLMLLSARELELALCGVPEIPLADWQGHTVYKGAFADQGRKHRVVAWFWAALEAWDNEKRARLLQWATGTSSVPAQGFDYLQGRDGDLRKFTLTSVDLDHAVYPRAHTCFNRIDLPLYETAADLRAGLDFVLTAGIAEAFSMD